MLVGVVIVWLSSRSPDYAQGVLADMGDENDTAFQIAEIMANYAAFADDDDDVRCTNISHIA